MEGEDLWIYLNHMDNLHCDYLPINTGSQSNKTSHCTLQPTVYISPVSDLIQLTLINMCDNVHFLIIEFKLYLPFGHMN